MPILTDIHLKVLSFGEQAKIAKVLTSIDAKIELNNRINAELEAMAKTLYDYSSTFPSTSLKASPTSTANPTNPPAAK